jgi:predicted enzyme related to lactoylglutathione lyase
MKRVTGIGGIFFKAKDPKTLQAWYERHLGIPSTPDGYIVFSWGGQDDQGHTVWSAMPDSTTYYQPSTQPFMINYRVDNLDHLLDVLKEEGVPIVGDTEILEYGKFAWIMDPEGNKIELWEPNDIEFRRINKMTL